MKQKYLNYVFALTFLITGYSFLYYNQNDYLGGQTLVDKQKLNIEEYEQKITTSEYNKILEKSKKENKNVLLFFIDTNCDWSDKFYQTINDEEINTYFSDHNYIKFYVNIDKDPDLFKKFKIESTPSYILIDKDEKIIKTGSGYKKKRDFLIWMRNIVKKTRLNK